MNAPLMKYRDQIIEEELGFSWEEYNALGILEAGKFGYKNPQAQQYVNRVRMLEKLDEPFPENWHDFNIQQQEKKAQATHDKEVEKMASHQLTCKKCGSHDLVFIGDNSKKFSTGKAVGGAVVAGALTGGIGLLVGGALGFGGKNGKKNQFMCNNCGNMQGVRK